MKTSTVPKLSVKRTQEEARELRELVRKIIMDGGSLMLFKNLTARSIRDQAASNDGNATIEARIKTALALIDTYASEIESLKEKARGKANI